MAEGGEGKRGYGNSKGIGSREEEEGQGGY